MDGQNDCEKKLTREQRLRLLPSCEKSAEGDPQLRRHSAFFFSDTPRVVFFDCLYWKSRESDELTSVAREGLKLIFPRLLQRPGGLSGAHHRSLKRTLNIRARERDLPQQQARGRFPLKFEALCLGAIQDAIDADRREAEILAESGRPCVHLGSGIKDLLKPRLSVPERLPLLFIHAVLHLLGFDHEEEGDAREMEAVEAAVFARFLRQAQPRGLLQGGGPAAPHFLLGTGLDVCSISRMQRFLLRQLRPDLERASKSSFVEARTQEKNAASPKPMSSFGQADETETRPLEKQVKDGKNKETASPGEAPVSASEIRVSQERPIGDPVGCISTRRLKRALDRILTPLEILDFQRRFGGLCELLDASWPGPKSASSVQEEGRNLRKRARKAFEGEEAKKAAATEPRRGTVAERERDREREETRALQRECREKNSENMGKENDADLSRTLRRASAFLAKRFAAKEALVKAMGGAGLRHLSSQGIRMRDIEIFQGLNGQPLVRLLGEALALQQQKRISNLFVSITDEGDIAMASATAVGT